MAETRALKTPLGLKLATNGFLVFWLLLAAFPLVWIMVMSFKLPLDAFAENPLDVLFGPVTRAAVGGLSLVDIVVGVAALYGFYRLAFGKGPDMARTLGVGGQVWLGWIATAIALALGFAITFVLVLPFVLSLVDAALGAIPGVRLLAEPLVGATTEHYTAVWVENGFYRQFVNSLIITAGVVTISLTVGTLAGYALARTGTSLAFWLLIAALVFRALPHSVLVTGYLPYFITSGQWMQPLWDWPLTGWFFGLFSNEAPTLYGMRLAVIIVLVSINQPFTIWMLRSFFQNIPAELDEAARVDGCSHFEAFWRVIMPVMWPGVITTGLFSFLLAYNDYLVTALLLDGTTRTMVPAITQYFNMETTTTDQVEAVAAAVSITAPLFILVMVFQRQIVSGLTAGAVKG